MELQIERRQVVKGLALTLFSLAAGGQAFAAGKKRETEEVNPPEDLMREHGVLRRVLLIYRDLIKALDSGSQVPWDRVSESADVVRTFVENYHERLEEQYVFPAMRKAGKLVDLVETLLRQHQAGRRLTDTVTGIAKRQGKEEGDARRLSTTLTQFITMYEPHAAREDTVLFPQLHVVWRGREFGKMGDIFERQEDRLFGEGGFGKMVDRVAAIEKAMGIYDLNRFTPGP